MSTFNAGRAQSPCPGTSNKTFVSSNQNGTFNLGNCNKTFDSGNPNQTFNITNPNRTFDVSSLQNRTYDAANSCGGCPQNQTFNAQRPLNQTYNANGPKQTTFNAGCPMNQTFNAQRPLNQTYNANGPKQTTFNAGCPQNQTFNAQRPLNQTYNANGPKQTTFNAGCTQDKTHNLQSPRNQTFNISNPRNARTCQNQTYDPRVQSDQTFNSENQIFGPEDLNYKFSDDENKLLDKIELLCTEIRSFIMSIYKFFCNNRNCNWEAVYKLIGEIDLTVQSMINEIFLQQMRIEDEREGTYYSDYQSSSNFVPSTFDNQSSSYEDSFEHESQSIMDDIQRRVNHLKVSKRSSDYLLQGLSNVEKAATNLRRFKNYQHLNLISDSEE